MKYIYFVLSLVFLASCVERQAQLTPPPQQNQTAATNQNTQRTQQPVNRVSTQSSTTPQQNYRFLRIGRIGDKSYNQTLTSPSSVSKEVFQVTGWGLQRNPVQPLKELYVEVGGRRYITNYGLSSPYVLQFVDNDQGASNVAFMVAIPTFDLPKGVQTVKLVGITNSGQELIGDQVGKVNIQ